MKENVSSVSRPGDRKALAVDVTVWVSSSWLIQVTVVLHGHRRRAERVGPDLHLSALHLGRRRDRARQQERHHREPYSHQRSLLAAANAPAGESFRGTNRG